MELGFFILDFRYSPFLRFRVKVSVILKLEHGQSERKDWWETIMNKVTCQLLINSHVSQSTWMSAWRRFERSMSGQNLSQTNSRTVPIVCCVLMARLNCALLLKMDLTRGDSFIAVQKVRTAWLYYISFL